MFGENIICFAKDWDEDPTSNHHVMSTLAENNRVLWLNSIATRRPDFASGRDLMKIWRKLLHFLRGPKKIHDRLWVYTPIVLPFPHNTIASMANKVILRLTVGFLRRKFHFKDFQLWTFLPNTGDYAGKLGESLVVYYCVDEWAGFSYIDGQKMAAMEQSLCQRADIVFATCRSLVEAKSKLNSETYLATHGVDHRLFARALDADLPVPDDIARLPQPVLGFYGTIQDWVDLDLLASLAERHPEWTIAMVGQVFVDIFPLKKYTNIHFLGRKPHSELPNYCKGFTVGIIPYIVNDRMRYVNPLKLREYLCAGLPVVSTAVPEVTYYDNYCTVARNHKEFECGIELALENDSAAHRQCRSDAMRTETWEDKVNAVSAQVMRIKTQKRRIAR